MTRRVRLIAVAAVMALVSAACTQASVDSNPAGATVATNFDPAVRNPPPPAPIAAVLRQPGAAGTAFTGSPTPLGAYVWSEAELARVEIWADGDLVEAINLEVATTEARFGIEWVPPASGTYALVARGIDVVGRTATSFPLWARVSDLPESAPTAAAALGRLAAPRSAPPFRVLAAQTVAPAPLGLLPYSPPPPAVVIDGDDCTATLTVAAISDAAGTAVYASVFGSAGFVPAGLVAPDGGEVTVPLGASPVALYLEAFDASISAPSPPLVIAPPNPCVERGWTGDLVLKNGVLGNNKGADRAYLFVSRDGGEIWDRAPSDDRTFVLPNAKGDLEFGPVLPPNLPGATVMFEAWGWVNDDLMPLGRGSYATPVPGFGDLIAAPHNGPLLADSGLDWVLGANAGPPLVREGTICTYPPTAGAATSGPTTPVSVVGGNAATTTTSGPVIATYPDGCTNAPLGNYSKVFRWTPISPLFDEGLLQVSTVPPPSSAGLSFPGMVLTQAVMKAAGTSVDFEVDIPSILNPPPSQAVLTSPENLTFQTIKELAGNARRGIAAFVPPPKLELGPPDTLYLRVVPTKNAVPLPGVSNWVVIHLDHQQAGALKKPDPIPGLSVTVQMTPPRAPNPAYQYCVRVLENPWGSKNLPPSQTALWFAIKGEPVPLNMYPETYYQSFEATAFVFENGAKVQKGMVPGATVCAFKPSPPDKDWWDYVVDAVNFVAFVWDTYSYLWDMLKEKVAEVLAVVSGCRALAEAAGASEDDAHKYCVAASIQVINYGLTAVGLPPSIPKVSELMESAKGDLADYVVAFGAQSGFLDCGETLQSQCEEWAKELVKQLIDKIHEQASKSAIQAVANSGFVLAVHPGIRVIPEPAGTLSPATFDIVLTRSADPNAAPPPTSCKLTGFVHGTKAHFEWWDYPKQKWVTGPVFFLNMMLPVNKTVDLSELKPGESIRVYITLDKLNAWYPPGQHPGLNNVPWNIKPVTWIFFNSWGTQSPTVKQAKTSSEMVLSGCGFSASQVFDQDAVPTEPWEIP